MAENAANNNPPLDPKTCAALNHPYWRGGLGGFICGCGEMHLLYHVGSREGGSMKRAPRATISLAIRARLQILRQVQGDRRN